MIAEIKETIEYDLYLLGETSMTVQIYPSRDAIMDVISSSNYEKDGEPGICFGGAFTKTETNDYQVNMIFDDTDRDEYLFSNMPSQQLDAVDKYERKPNFEDYMKYKYGGYSYLQNLFSNALLRQETGRDNASIAMSVAPMMNSEYNDDDFIEVAAYTWMYFMAFIFVVPLYRFISNSVSDKESRVRQAMKVMGLTDFPYWLSWFSFYALTNTLQCLLMLPLLIPIFEQSNLLLVFLYFWLYGISLFGLGVFVASFFSSAKTAAIVGTMLIFFTSFFTVIVQEEYVDESVKILSSIFPIVAVQLAGNNLIEFEASGNGLTFDNANELFKNYRFSTVLWMNVISFFFFGLLGLYLENVMPSAVGVRKPLWFPFMKSYWCGSKKSEYNQRDSQDYNDASKAIASNDIDNDEEYIREIHEDYFEDVPDFLRRKEDDNQFIKIKNLKKKFGDNFYAINDLNAEMYEDQIFALLGHNGAGKTTTISALCGMLAPSGGSASIYGYSIKDDMKQIRKITGF